MSKITFEKAQIALGELQTYLSIDGGKALHIKTLKYLIDQKS